MNWREFNVALRKFQRDSARQWQEDGVIDEKKQLIEVARKVGAAFEIQGCRPPDDVSRLPDGDPVIFWYVPVGNVHQYFFVEHNGGGTIMETYPTEKPGVFKEFFLGVDDGGFLVIQCDKPGGSRVFPGVSPFWLDGENEEEKKGPTSLTVCLY